MVAARESQDLELGCWGRGEDGDVAGICGESWAASDGRVVGRSDGTLDIGWAPREAMIVAVRRVQGADVREEAICLVVDGEPYSGWSASSDGTTVRGTVVDQMVVVTIGGGDPVSLTLGSSDRC